MRFRYIGEEYSEFMGFKWMTGTEHDVTDEHAIGKLSNSVLFEKVGGEAPAAAGADGTMKIAAKKPGRPKKPEAVTDEAAE